VDLLEGLRDATVFSVLDAKSGYWQVAMEPASVEKTAFSCHEGLFEYVVMPFGLCNAPATYQRAMNAILADVLYVFCFVYLDDVLVFSRTEAEHGRHLMAAEQGRDPAELGEVLLLPAPDCVPRPYRGR
jgi:hypothetical protein